MASLVAAEGRSSTSSAYSCQETLATRGSPRAGQYTLEDSGARLEDVSHLWLPAGISSRLEVGLEGQLVIGLGWLDKKGSRLFMERHYGCNGRLQEVRSGSEVKE